MAPQPESEVGEVIIFQAEDGNTILEVRLDHETVRLSQDQMSELFGKERSVITKHLRNVFKEGKSEESAVRAKMHILLWMGKPTRRNSILGHPIGLHITESSGHVQRNQRKCERERI